MKVACGVYNKSGLLYIGILEMACGGAHASSLRLNRSFILTLRSLLTAQLTANAEAL